MVRFFIFIRYFIVFVSCIFAVYYFVLIPKNKDVVYSLSKTDCYFHKNLSSYRYIVSSFLGSDEIIYSLLDLYNKRQDKEDDKNRYKYKIRYSYLSRNVSYSNISSYISDNEVFLPNIEYIMVERPDLVFSSYYNNINYINSLFQIRQPNCILTKFSTVKDILENISFISLVLNLEKEGKFLIKDIEEKIYELKEKFKNTHNRKNILIYMPKDFSIGSGTVLNDFLNTIGFNNVMSKKSGFFKLNEEELIKLNIDYVMVVVNKTFNKKDFKSSVKKSVISDIEAVKEERYLFIEESVAFSVSNYIKDISSSFYDIDG